MKKCSTCKVEKELSEFNKQKANKDGLQGQCKDCKNEYSKQWKQANKGNIKEYNKEWCQANKEHNNGRVKQWYQANKEKKKEYSKQYRQNNKEKINKYHNNRRATDPLFKLKAYLRVRTRKAFINKGYSKTSKTQEMLGVDWEIVKSHIERQFTKGMNWDNYGEWHIDHIIPLASANNEKELLKLCHYSNLQPLWAEDNLIKNDKIIECQVKLRI